MADEKTELERNTANYLQLVDMRAAWQVNRMAWLIHALNEKWWLDPATGKRLGRNVGELLMLCVSELAEALEGHRKGLEDDKLPGRPMLEVELADCVIRIFDMAGGMGLDLGGTLLAKLEYNITRPDHQTENRLKEGGKRY
jgi:NTP pyrophosphatase (non-canonical NTP hydrolase)